ncbi:hypothetical protein GCM10027275_06010 [Rhabdobacter roseus]|uniref:Glycine/serine hydroxymethyltransferase n=1 Tax=Rhabdobacter roseus TaxID=1655419 RepID=A0A840TMQ4_9BACT|nr:hypothetical protein [Rhabdobacter roseus]MBB5282493.1 glycine/serine hydroxymethyltransferase [Rhabdobacter roseus]
MTTHGLLEIDMERIVELIDTVLMHHDNDAKLATVKQKVNNWMKQHLLYS